MRRGYLVGVLAAVLLAGCSQTSEVGKGSGFVYADAGTALVKSADRAPMPVNLPARTLTGATTPDTAGKVVLLDRKSTRLNSSHVSESRMPSSA